MPLKNYTTSISVEKTIMEIEQILAQFGAENIYKMFKDSKPIGLAFEIMLNGKPMSFKLPMKEGKVVEVFKKAVNKRELPKRYWEDHEQARRTGWRILKDWIDSQVALMEIELVQLHEVFLPYMYDKQLGKTLFELLEKKEFDLNQIGYNGDDNNGEKEEELED